MLRRTAAALLCLALISVNLFADEPTYILAGRSRPGAALRSVFLPGWGQYYNEQKTKAYIMGTTVILSLGAAYVLYTRANNTFTDYENLGVKGGSLYDDYQAQSNQAMVASIFGIGLWAWCVIDAYIYADIPAPQAMNRDGLRVACNRGQAGLAYSRKF